MAAGERVGGASADRAGTPCVNVAKGATPKKDGEERFWRNAGDSSRTFSLHRTILDGTARTDTTYWDKVYQAINRLSTLLQTRLCDL